MSTPFLEAVALACERDWRLLFDKLDLRLERGEMLQISGPNGSGKTSLLRLLSGLMQPTSGEVRLGGSRWMPSVANWRATCCGSVMQPESGAADCGRKSHCSALCINPRAATRSGKPLPR